MCCEPACSRQPLVNSCGRQASFSVGLRLASGNIERWRFELKIGTQVTPGLENVQASFDFLCLVDWLGNRRTDGQTGGRDPLCGLLGRPHYGQLIDYKGATFTDCRRLCNSHHFLWRLRQYLIVYTARDRGYHQQNDNGTGWMTRDCNWANWKWSLIILHSVRWHLAAAPVF